MKTIGPDIGGWRRVVLAIVAVSVFAAIGLVLYGEWATSVGFAGLMSRLSTAGGFIVFGVALAGVFAVFASDFARERIGTRGPQERAQRRRAALRKVGVVALNVLVYGGTAVLALGGLASLDGAGFDRVAFVIALWAVCVVTLVLYRRHRKRHRVSYDGTGALALCAFCLLLACLGFFGGWSLGGEAVVDLVRGPLTEVCTLADVSEDAPSGRYQALQQTVVQVEFAAADGRTVRVVVAKTDANELASVADAGGVVRLTYYPRTNVFVSAEPIGGFLAGAEDEPDDAGGASAR